MRTIALALLLTISVLPHANTALAQSTSPLTRSQALDEVFHVIEQLAAHVPDGHELLGRSATATRGVATVLQESESARAMLRTVAEGDYEPLIRRRGESLQDWDSRVHEDWCASIIALGYLKVSAIACRTQGRTGEAVDCVESMIILCEAGSMSPGVTNPMTNAVIALLHITLTVSDLDSDIAEHDRNRLVSVLDEARRIIDARFKSSLLEAHETVVRSVLEGPVEHTFGESVRDDRVLFERLKTIDASMSFAQDHFDEPARWDEIRVELERANGAAQPVWLDSVESDGEFAFELYRVVRTQIEMSARTAALPFDARYIEWLDSNAQSVLTEASSCS
ncbi:MAG: hypothetical protein AAGD00_00370 [Planctomycetota bacterium]